MQGLDFEGFTVGKLAIFDDKDKNRQRMLSGPEQIFNLYAHIDVRTIRDNMNTQMKNGLIFGKIKKNQVAPNLGKEQKTELQLKELNKNYLKSLNDTKNWVTNYNLQNQVIKLLQMVIMSSHSKQNSIVESVACSLLSVYSLIHIHSVVRTGGSNFTGFGVGIWLNMFFELIMLSVFACVVLV